MRTETARLESAVAGRLGERAEREEKVRREVSKKLKSAEITKQVLYFQLLIPPKRFDIFSPRLGDAEKV